jgi:hypothetical protein
MIFQVTSVYRRPSEDIMWHGSFVINAELEEQKTIFTITNFYRKHEILNETPDSNTLIVKSRWESEEAYNTFRNEPCIAEYFNLVDQYFQTVGIVSEPKIKEIIEESFN